VYRYVSAAVGDGRTQRANRRVLRYGFVPRMMVSPPARDLSIELFGKIWFRRQLQEHGAYLSRCG
jgi:hypothetical protein